MAKFVNYKKRSIDLPAGSKNLIDVLKGGGVTQPVPSVYHPATVPHCPPTTTRSETFTGRIPDIEKYVTMVFESHSFSFGLSMTPVDEKLALTVSRMEGEIIWASGSVQFDTDLERAVRRFFVHRGLPVPEDSETPSVFLPDMPVQISYDITPLPSEASILSRFAADLLREVQGLTADSQLTFTIYETTLVI